MIHVEWYPRLSPVYTQNDIWQDWVLTHWGLNGAGTKWLTFCRRRFQIYFPNWQILYFNQIFKRVQLTLIQHWFRQVILCVCIPPPKRITRSYPSSKNTPVSRILDEKKNLFQPKSLILRPNKTPFFKQNAIFSWYKLKYPFCESENICNCIKLKTFFYIFSYIPLLLNYG